MAVQDDSLEMEEGGSMRLRRTSAKRVMTYQESSSEIETTSTSGDEELEVKHQNAIPCINLLF